MEKIRGKSLKEWKKYCAKDNVPIKTMKYIICLEERIESLTIQRVIKSFTAKQVADMLVKDFTTIEEAIAYFDTIK